MSRNQRASLASQTLAILEQGWYTTASGQRVGIQPQLQDCLAQTRHYLPHELELLRNEVLARPSRRAPQTIEVRNETTLAGISRLIGLGHAQVAALNFASAKNPGGGFLGGSQAQEESLARSSGLYASLLQAPEFYAGHRRQPSLLYSHAMILSPACPIFRRDDGTLLEYPQLVGLITSAAPNAGAIRNNQPAELAQIPTVLRQRAEYVLSLAAHLGYQQLVLGAWGCGVFRNDPNTVADTFAALLQAAPWRTQFERVVFSVFDNSPELSTFNAFRLVFAQSG